MAKKNIHSPLVWTALITPLNARGKIDYSSLAYLAEKQAAAGNGILLLGSTGESLALTTAERQHIVKFIAKQRLGTPIMVGVGGYQLNKQIKWLYFCACYSEASAYLLTAPLYAKPGYHGQCQWFRALLDQANAPCMLYNIPSRTGCTILPEVLQTLENHPKLWALKEASGSLKQFRKYQGANIKLHLYSGEDSMIPTLAIAGARGLVSVASNIWPDATKTYAAHSLVLSDSHRHFALQAVWNPAIRTIFTTTNPIAVKALLAYRQWIKTPYLRPPLSHTELTDLAALLQADSIIQAWHQNIIHSPKVKI